MLRQTTAPALPAASAGGNAQPEPSTRTRGFGSQTMRRRRRFGSAPQAAQADFERLLRPHLDHLYKLAYRFTGATDRAEDLIQDLLVRIYPRGAELSRIEQPRPWLLRVMYRIFIDQKRRETRAPYVSIAETDIGDLE